jgi:N-acyl-D-amino-acid deacylase
MDEDGLKQVLAAPFTTIGSDGNAVSPTGLLSKGKPHPRYYGTFPRILGKYSREEKVFDLPTAIRKMTSQPARKFGLKQRGEINPGYFADLVIFDPAKVIDRATFTDPHQLSGRH